MMAQDPSLPRRGRLSTETLAMLERVLARYARDGSDDGAVGAALTQLAGEARERAIPPEEVLVELKTLWGGLPAVARRGAGDQHVEMLQRVVTMCIKSYYR